MAIDEAANPLESMGKAAKEASYALGTLSGAEKNALLLSLAAALEAGAESILAANAKDLEAAAAAGLREIKMAGIRRSYRVEGKTYVEVFVPLFFTLSIQQEGASK